MAAPTQVYPAWLSVSTSIATDANGNPTATGTTVINLPLTYYGPPIPLGTDGAWVYGGLTSPPPQSATPSPSVASSASVILSTSSAIPSSITSSSTSPSSLSSSSSTSLQSSSSTTSSSAATSSTSAAAASGRSSSRTRVLVGSILGAVLGSLLLLFLVIFLVRRRSRRRTGLGSPRRRRDNPLWMWEMVDPPPPGQDSEGREAGEGSPRGSGEEHDSFLRRSVGATDGMKERDPSARLIGDPQASSTATAMGVAAAGSAALDNSRSTRGSGEKTSTSGSQYASASGGSSGSRPSAGAQHIIPRDVLLRMYPDDDADSPATHTGGIRAVQDDDDHEPRADSPLLPPPPLSVSTLPFGPRKESRQSLLTEGSVTPGNEPDLATVQTARRVRVDDLGPRLTARTLTTVEDESPRDEAGPAWARAVGLGVAPLAKLRRLSLLGRSSQATARSRPASRPASLVAQGLTDADIEGGRAAMAGLRPEMGFRDDVRPISTVSGRSAVSSGGNTVYHDATSRPQTPGLSPVPQSTTSTAGRGPGPSQLAISHGPEASGSASEPESAPPAYEATPPADYPGATALAGTNGASAPDVLDMPAPPPETPFAQRSRPGSVAPPGLMPLVNTRAWRNSASVSGESPLSLGSRATASGASSEAGITIDVLEEAPPAAGAGWRSMARGLAGEQDHRTTFGMPPVYVHPRETTVSHEGSLHSMRSHLSPHSARSASGSAPASSRHAETPSGGSGSSYSHPSGRSRSGSSGISLVHSASITSDGRRRLHPSDLSPPISAVGRSSMVPPLPAAARATSPLHHARSATVTSTGTTATGSSVTTHTSVTDPLTGDVMRFPHVPWTGGREQRETGEGDSWAGSWGSPAHLRALQSRVADQDVVSHS